MTAQGKSQNSEARWHKAQGSHDNQTIRVGTLKEVVPCGLLLL